MVAARHCARFVQSALIEYHRGTFFRGTRLSPYVPTTLNRGDTFALGGSGNILQVI